MLDYTEVDTCTPKVTTKVLQQLWQFKNMGNFHHYDYLRLKTNQYSQFYSHICSRAQRVIKRDLVK